MDHGWRLEAYAARSWLSVALDVFFGRLDEELRSSWIDELSFYLKEWTNYISF